MEDVPNSQKAMEGYIALSRVTDAEGLIIAQPFAPTFFQQGPAPYPTLLLQVQKGEVSQLARAAGALTGRRRKDSVCTGVGG